ncbi:MAG: methionine biosynthesis protein MetW [Burkholderiaceae bacterium]
MTLRADLELIADWIAPGAHVLDLGCGDGALLAHLRNTKGCRGYGVDIADANVLAAARRRVNVIQADLESGLRMFRDDMFDIVVLSQTLQAMRRVEDVLREMARVARHGIVSFPNFGHWRHILSLLGGHMPVSRSIPYQWYDTPNIHLCTPKDFEILAAKLGFSVKQRALLADGREVGFAPHLRAELAVYRFDMR